MANSDNVLRAGLTAKHIDIDELVANVRFQEKKVDPLMVVPSVRGNSAHYRVPVPDFSLSIITLSSACRISTDGLPQLILCLQGTLRLSSAQDVLTLSLGESAFVPASQGSFTLEGYGQIALATVGSTN